MSYAKIPQVYDSPIDIKLSLVRDAILAHYQSTLTADDNTLLTKACTLRNKYTVNFRPLASSSTNSIPSRVAEVLHTLISLVLVAKIWRQRSFKQQSWLGLFEQPVGCG